MRFDDILHFPNRSPGPKFTRILRWVAVAAEQPGGAPAVRRQSCSNKRMPLMDFSKASYGLLRKAQNGPKRKVWRPRVVREVRQPSETLPGGFGEAARPTQE